MVGDFKGKSGGKRKNVWGKKMKERDEDSFKESSVSRNGEGEVDGGVGVWGEVIAGDKVI